MVKVLQVLPELGSGGVERGTVEVARALQESGSQALVASAGGVMVDELTRYGATHFELPLTSKNPFTMWQNVLRLSEIIKREKVEIVHARSRAPAWSAYYAAKRTGVPFITTFHGVYNGYGKGLKHRYNEIMTRGERIIAVSNFVGEHVAKEYGASSDIIRVIHRGADVEYFHPEKSSGVRTMDLCQKWHLPEGLPVILLPGRLTRWKGQHVLLKALSQLPHRQFYCVLLGEQGKHPGYKRELEKLVEKYKLHGHVRMAGTSRDMRDAYNVADVVISPAIEPEAFGRVPVEAQAMGKPIIATSHGGAMETVMTGETGTGWLVPPGDSKALSQAIEQALMLDENSKQALAQNARQHVVANFSTEAMCNKVLGVYDQVIKDRKLVPKAA
ncbi:MAG: glycosyltransferase family 4 protein [Rickettsiales bacterium]|nr:glycosyltransferase family 4 protein [Rickettsiales bacterium]